MANVISQASVEMPVGGLSATDLALIQHAARAIEQIEEVVLFGSRAMAVQKRGSDVDLAIKGSAVNYDVALALSGSLNEDTPLPYFFDVLDYAAISDTPLREHIDRVGYLIFKR